MPDGDRSVGGTAYAEVCPQCESEHIEGRSGFNIESETKMLEGDGVNRRIERWYEIECRVCDLIFATRERVVNREVQPESDHDE